MWLILADITLVDSSTLSINDTSIKPIWKFLSSIVKLCVFKLVLLNPLVYIDLSLSKLPIFISPPAASNDPVIWTLPFTLNW